MRRGRPEGAHGLAHLGILLRRTHLLDRLFDSDFDRIARFVYRSTRQVLRIRVRPKEVLPAYEALGVPIAVCLGLIQGFHTDEERDAVLKKTVFDTSLLLNWH